MSQEQVYSLYDFWINPFEVVDLSRFFLMSGIADTSRKTINWRLTSVDNVDEEGNNITWASGSVSADGILGVATFITSIPEFQFNNATFTFTNNVDYGDQMALQIAFEPEPTRQCDQCGCPPTDPSTDACLDDPLSTGRNGTVGLRSGRFTHQIPLLSASGPGLGGWQFGLNYYSSSGTDSLIGKNFSFPQFSYLVELGATGVHEGEHVPMIYNVELVASDHTRVIFEAQYYEEPPEVEVYLSDDNNSAAVLTRSGDGADNEFTLTASDGTVTQFFGFDPAVETPGQMKSITDRNGNSQTFTWQSVGGIAQLASATDTYGRTVQYRYYGADYGYRLREIEDFLGRKLNFQYDSLGHLVAVVTCAITQGAPGNTFPAGRAYVFQYDINNSRVGRRDDLIRMWYPNEATPYIDEATRTVDVARVIADATPRYVIEYGQDPTDANTWGKVLAETVGDPANGVGGIYRYDYTTEDLPENIIDETHPIVARTTMTDRNSNRTIHDFNDQGMPARVEVLRNRSKIDIPSGSSFVTWTKYNDQNQPLVVVYPEGNSVEYVYDDGMVEFGLETELYVKRRGLLLTRTRKPGNSIGIPSRAGSNGQEELSDVTLYDPIYNQPCVRIEPRGNPIDEDTFFTPQNGGEVPDAEDRSRYATIAYMDYQKDGLGAIMFDAYLQALLGLDSGKISNLLEWVDEQVIAFGIPSGFEIDLGDINGDGTGDGASSGLPEATHLGNVVKVKHPDVLLVGATTQVREELFTTNLRGQTTTHTDPEGNLTVYVRYPLSDPEGDGQSVSPALGSKQYGQLKEVHVDADPNDVMSLIGSDGDLVDFVSSIIERTNTPDVYQDLTTRYEGAGTGGCTSCAYDPMGNPLAMTDPRGFITRYDRNELGEVYRTTSPQPYNFRSEVHYDANRNVTRTDTEDLVPAFDSEDPTSICYAQFSPSGSGTTAHVPMKPGPGGAIRPGWFTNLMVYDLIDNKIEDDIDATGSHPSSLVTTYEYDPNQNTIKITKPEGNTVEYDYDERNLRIAERVGFVAGAGAEQIPGAVTISAYDGNGNLIQVIGPAQRGDEGNWQTVNINDYFRSTQLIEHTGDFLVENTLDGFDRVIQTTDNVGNVTLFTHDPDGRVIETIFQGPIGGATPDNRDGEDNVDLTDSIQRYDEAGRLYESQQDVFAATGTSLPSAPDRSVTHTGGGLATNSIANDHTGTSTIIEDGEATVESSYVLSRTVYDRAGRVASTLADNTAELVNTYDGAGRKIRTVDPLANAVDYEYDRGSNLTLVTRTEVCTITAPTVEDEVFRSATLYDALGRPIIQASQGADAVLDLRLLSCLSDALWQVSSETLVTRRGYDSRGNATLSIDPKGNTSLAVYDGASRSVQVIQHLRQLGEGHSPPETGSTFLPHAGSSITTTRFLDGNGRLKQLVDDRGSITAYEYDLQDRQTIMTFQDGSTRLWVYNEAGDATTYTDENQVVFTYTLDSLGRRTRIDIAPAAFTELQQFQYDGLSRLTFCNDQSSGPQWSHVTLVYDSLSRIMEDSQLTSMGDYTRHVTNTAFTSYPVSGFMYPNDRELFNSYDLLYRRTLVEEADGGDDIAAWQFFGPSRVAEVKLGPDSLDLYCTFMNNARTHSAVQPGVSNPAWGNQSSDRLGYDGAGRPIAKRYLLTGLTDNAYTDTSALVGFTTSYDRANNKRFERQLHAESRSHLYQPFDAEDNPLGGIDSADRLRQYQRGVLDSTGGYGNLGGGSIATPISLPNAVASRSYELDGLGNWHKTVFAPVGGSATTEIRQHNGLNQITSVKTGSDPRVDFEYDGTPGHSNGNLQNDGQFTYFWDGFNRLRNTSVDGSPPNSNYWYDAMGRRISRRGEPWTDFIWMGWQCVEERDGDNNPTKQYVWGTYIDECVQMKTLEEITTGTGDDETVYPAGDYYPLQDLLYRTTATVDDTGAIVESYDYDAYGNTLIFNAPGTADNWWADDVTQVANPLCEVLFTGQRYDAETGLYYYRRRYYAPAWGRFVSKDPIEYEGNGFYVYVLSNPIIWLDPEGLLEKGPGNAKYYYTHLEKNRHGRYVWARRVLRCTVVIEFGHGSEQDTFPRFSDLLLGGQEGPPAPDEGRFGVLACGAGKYNKGRLFIAGNFPSLGEGYLGTKAKDTLTPAQIKAANAGRGFKQAAHDSVLTDAWDEGRKVAKEMVTCGACKDSTLVFLCISDEDKKELGVFNQKLPDGGVNATKVLPGQQWCGRRETFDSNHPDGESSQGQY